MGPVLRWNVLTAHGVHIVVVSGLNLSTDPGPACAFEWPTEYLCLWFHSSGICCDMTSPYLPVSSRLQCSGVAYPNLATVQFKARGPCVAGIPGYYAPPLECSTEPSQLGNLHVMVFNKLVSECDSCLAVLQVHPV